VVRVRGFPGREIRAAKPAPISAMTAAAISSGRARLSASASQSSAKASHRTPQVSDRRL